MPKNTSLGKMKDEKKKSKDRDKQNEWANAQTVHRLCVRLQRGAGCWREQKKKLIMK